MLWLLIVVLLILALGGGIGYSRVGYAGFSPLVFVLVVLLILWALGVIH